MRIIQFAKWWWNTHDVVDRAMALFFLIFILPAAFSSIFIGPWAILIILGGLVSVLIGFVLFGIFHLLRAQWRKFNIECPTDDVRIVNRLKGIDN